MAVATRGTSSNYLQRAPSPSGLADVLDLILDKGLVIDAYVRVAVIGIELITIDARIVIASVDTYLRFAEAVHQAHERVREFDDVFDLDRRPDESGWGCGFSFRDPEGNVWDVALKYASEFDHRGGFVYP